MGYERFMSRVDFIVFGNDKWRINVKKNNQGNPDVTYDAHGLSVREARRTIENIVNISRDPLQLKVIHGYNHGTAIKDMLCGEAFSGRIQSKFCPAENPGVTIMNLAPAA